MTTSYSAPIKTITSGVEVFKDGALKFNVPKCFLISWPKALLQLDSFLIERWPEIVPIQNTLMLNQLCSQETNPIAWEWIPYSLVFTRQSNQLKLKERFYRRGRYLKVKYNMNMHLTRMLELYSNVVNLIRKPAVTIMDIWMKIIENNWYYFEKELFVNNNENIIIPNVLYTFYSENWSRPILSLNVLDLVNALKMHFLSRLAFPDRD